MVEVRSNWKNHFLNYSHIFTLNSKVHVDD
jgi:hypothetical protein